VPYLTGAASYVNSAMVFGSSATDITTFLDGLGRPKRLQQRKGPAPNSSFDTTTQTYDVNEKLALMTGQTLSKGFIPLPGGTQVKYNAGNVISTYRVADWLGSLRIGSNPNRTYAWSQAFAPFGERYAAGGTPA